MCVCIMGSKMSYGVAYTNWKHFHLAPTRISAETSWQRAKFPLRALICDQCNVGEQHSGDDAVQMFDSALFCGGVLLYSRHNHPKYRDLTEAIGLIPSCSVWAQDRCHKTFNLEPQEAVLWTSETEEMSLTFSLNPVWISDWKDGTETLIPAGCPLNVQQRC